MRWPRPCPAGARTRRSSCAASPASGTSGRMRSRPACKRVRPGAALIGRAGSRRSRSSCPDSPAGATSRGSIWPASSMIRPGGPTPSIESPWPSTSTADGRARAARAGWRCRRSSACTTIRGSWPRLGARLPLGPLRGRPRPTKHSRPAPVRSVAGGAPPARRPAPGRRAGPWGDRSGRPAGRGTGARCRARVRPGGRRVHPRDRRDRERRDRRRAGGQPGRDRARPAGRVSGRAGQRRRPAPRRPVRSGRPSARAGRGPDRRPAAPDRPCARPARFSPRPARPSPTNVRIAGSLLAGQRYLRERCGDGVALASGRLAAAGSRPQ